jgi:RHS repeat-associated protein
VYDVGGGLPVLLDDGARKYVWGSGLAYSVDKSSGAVGVYHTDGLGSVRAITDSSVNVIQSYQTDEFGVPTHTQGASPQPFGFTQQQHDPEAALLYLRAREYDPALGRFIQRDNTFGNRFNPQQLNRFSYSLNSPVTFTDPSGHVAIGQAQELCYVYGWTCNDLTHDMAVELLEGNATPIDWADPSVFTNGSPLDITLFLASTLLGGGPELKGIKITADAFAHVLERHTIYGAGAIALNRATRGIGSLFANPEEVANLIRAAESFPTRPGKYPGTVERIGQADHIIGWDRATRAPTSTYTVVTRANGELITAHPGLP